MHLSFQLIRTRFLALLDYNRERRSRTQRSSSNSFYSRTQFRAVIHRYLYIIYPPSRSMVHDAPAHTRHFVFCFLFHCSRGYRQMPTLLYDFRSDQQLTPRSEFIVHLFGLSTPFTCTRDTFKAFRKSKALDSFFYFLPFSRDSVGKQKKKRKRKESRGKKLQLFGMTIGNNSQFTEETQL